MAETRFVICERCQGEGRLYVGRYEDERDAGECPACEGTGMAEITVEPVTLDDEELTHAAQ